MNQKTNAAKAAGVSTLQNENAPAENSKGASKKHRHFIVQFICSDLVFYSLALIAWSIFGLLYQRGAV